MLKDLDLTLEPGRVGAILGPSGCGKTTLLRMVAGLDPCFQGSVRLPGAGRLSMVFQEPRLIPWRSVEDNIRFVVPTIGDEALHAQLAALGLAEHGRHLPGALSLGLARRVAIARALAVRPDILLLDEPFASLDRATAAQLLAQLVDLVEARPVTSLLVTHDPTTAVRLADAVFVLSARPARVLARIDIPPPRRGLTAVVTAALLTRIAAAI